MRKINKETKRVTDDCVVVAFLCVTSSPHPELTFAFQHTPSSHSWQTWIRVRKNAIGARAAYQL